MGDLITADAVWQNVPGGPYPMLTGATAVADPVLVEFDVPIPGLGGSEFSIDFFADNTFTIVFDPADLAAWPIDIDIVISDMDFSPPGGITDVQQTASNISGFLDVISFTASSISISSSAASAGGSRFYADFSYTTDSAGGNTPAGTNVVVQPVDLTTATTPVTLTFDEVTVAGETTLVTGPAGPALPLGYELCDPDTYYDLWTTATMAAASSVEVCIDISGMDCSLGPPSLQAWDSGAGIWVDVTTSSSASEICGVADELTTFAVFVPNVAEPCVTIRRVLTGEQPNTLGLVFNSGCGPGAVVTAIEINMGSGHTVAPTTGITCIPNTHTWTGAGTSTARIDFSPPIAMGSSYTECIADDLGFYWSSGQSVTVYISCYTGPLSYTVSFDDFYDIVTTKTFKVSEATVGCTPTPTLGFTFDDGDAEGWFMEGAYRETGGAAVSHNFSFLWEDSVDYPTAIPADPTGDDVGAIGIVTPGGHGVPSVGNAWWIMRFYSPDLSADPIWQGATGFSVKLGENMAATATLNANLFVVVYDFDQAQNRFFFNDSAAPIALGDWTSFSFDWSGIGTFPTNYEVRNVFVNLWGTMAGSYNGGVYLDDVVPIVPAPTSVQPPSRAPLSFRLHKPAPNPFNPQTTLRFDLTRPANVSLKVYDVAGRLVRELLANRYYGEGVHEQIWNGRDDSGRIAASGVYIARMEAGGAVQSRRMLLLK